MRAIPIVDVQGIVGRVFGFLMAAVIVASVTGRLRKSLRTWQFKINRIPVPLGISALPLRRGGQHGPLERFGRYASACRQARIRQRHNVTNVVAWLAAGRLARYARVA